MIWVSLRKRKPALNHTVLVSDGKSITFGRRRSAKLWECQFTPTHWMEPILPNGKKVVQ